MRIVLVSLLALLCPAVAMAQSNAPNAASRSEGVTKTQYLDRVKERAEKRFDKLDANHDGVLTAEERRNARKKKLSPQQTGAH